MTALMPMRTEIYADFMKSAMARYAKDIADLGLLPFEKAVERSRIDYEGRLPQGLTTPDNYLFEIVAEGQRENIGFLWFCIQEQDGCKTAFVCEISIHAKWRRQGHATRAFRIMETRIKELGVFNIALHVFGCNVAAQNLYNKLGYGVTNVYMLKKLMDESEVG